MPTTAVVILNYNGRHYLERFLAGVIANSPATTVIVADNASTDDSVSYLKLHFPQVQIIQNPVNTGFAQGYNDALAVIEGQYKYYVLLNSDIEVTPNWIEPIVNLMEENTSVAACQPKLLAYDEPTYFEYAGAAGGFIDWLGYPFCRGRIFDMMEEDKGQYNDTRAVFWATGACMVVRSSVFHQLGGFDGAFFAHMEEVDLCWRMQNAGHQVFYCAESMVYHIGGGTLHKSNPHKTYLNFRNNLMMLFKNWSGAQLLMYLLPKLLLDGVAGLKFLLSGNRADCWAVVRAHFYWYGNIKELWIKRKNTQNAILKRDTTYVYPRLIVLDYFMRAKKRFTQLNW